MNRDPLIFFDQIERAFLDEIESLSLHHPGWWYLFTQKIIKQPLFTHFTDTTIIISVYEMPVNLLIVLYEILKRFHKIKATTKIINKKEFVIVHLYSEKILQYLENENKWMSYVFYQQIKTLDYDLKYRFNNQDQSFDLMIKNNDQTIKVITKITSIDPNSFYLLISPYQLKLAQKYDNIRQLTYFHDLNNFVGNIKKMFKKLKL